MPGAPTKYPVDAEGDEQIIPIAREHLNVDIAKIVTGAVDISTVTHLRDVVVDEALISAHAEVERVQIGRVVDTAPAIREEDGVLIIPVIEEVAVVERRLVLKEEVRVRRSTNTRRHRETVTLRQQKAVIHRTVSKPDTAQSGSVPATPEEILP